MAAISELDLPRLDYLDPELRGDRFHDVMLGLAEESWIAKWDLGYFVLDREAAGFFLRTDKAAFPGVRILELVGITDGPLYESLSNNIISLTGDQHRRLRKLVHGSFTPKAADRYRPAMREILAELHEAVRGEGACDFVSAFAKPYPARMIATVIGAPPGDAARLHELSNLLQSQFDAIALATRREELEAAAVEFDEYVERLVTARREDLGDDLVSRLIAAEEEGDRLSHDECVGLVRDALNGGIDTTQSQLAHGVRLFADHPDQWELLGREPERAPAAAEEVLRFEPVAPFTTRILLEDVEYRGVEFPKDTIVTVSQFNANRDLGNGDASSFDIAADRGSGKALTFGAGPHFCMGANLARAELQEGLAFLAAHLERLALDGEPEYGTITGLYGLEALPISFAAA
ncbi:MAG TPA: cytochrome P450 [Thermoleophilaceae bacterium]|jgi:cytochrome P450